MHSRAQRGISPSYLDMDLMVLVGIGMEVGTPKIGVGYDATFVLESGCPGSMLGLAEASEAGSTDIAMAIVFQWK